MSMSDEARLRIILRKELAGEKLTGDEARALRRHEKDEDERRRWAVYAAIPKKDYVAMSGRQYKVIDEQGERYGLEALKAPVIDLRALLRQMHDLLAAKWHQFGKEVEAEALLLGGPGKSPATERYRGFKADLAKLEVEEKQRELLPRDDTKAGLLVIASTIRLCCEHLEREFGAEARALVDQALDDAVEKIEQMFPGAEAVDS